MGKRKDAKDRSTPPPDAESHLGVDSIETNSADDEECGISLEELSSSYAQMISQGAVPYQQDEPVEAESDDGSNETPVFDAVAEELIESDQCPVTPMSILEALLFVGCPDNASLEADTVAGLMRGVRSAEIQQLVSELNELYATQGHVMRIVASGEGYRMQLAEEFHSVRERFYGNVRQIKLTQAAIDCLAIIAYRPGITREELDHQRSQSSSAILNQLVRRELVQMRRDTGKKEATRRYYATDRLLELAGIDSLEELPLAEDFER